MNLAIPPLNEGEIYAGAIGNKHGDVEHIILLPGDNEGATWKAQSAWAKGLGGDLPSRVEQALLYATCRDQFKEAAYWSNETHADDASWAWFQYFLGGYQGHDRKNDALRAVAVRRVLIEDATTPKVTG